LLAILLYATTYSLLAQGVEGTVAETFSRQPIAEATVVISFGDSIAYEGLTNESGHYDFQTNKAGRINVHVTREGFTDYKLSDIMLDGYTTQRLEHLLEKTSFALPGITVTARQHEPASFIRTITPDDLLQISGNFEDPVRIAHSQPGIVQLNDQANQLSARGQTPIFNSWYLEGLEIVNPNHTSNAGTLSDLPTQYGGGVNMFSAQTLGSTDIYMGVNPLSVNTNSGAAIDMHLHESAKPEWRAKAGLLGMELGGGAALGANSILDFNLRYSFTGILTNLGADFGGEKINFYDGVISFRNEGAMHKLKFFAWAGRSINEFDHVDPPEDRERYKDFFDIDYDNDILGAGGRYDVTLSPKLFLKTGFAYSTNQSAYTKSGQFGQEPETFDLDGRVNIISSFADLTIRHSSRIHSAAGIEYTNRSYRDRANPFIPFGEESLLRPYVNTSLQFAPDWKIEAGAELQRSFQYDTWIPGYRAELAWTPNEHHAIFAGLRHSGGEPLYTTSQKGTRVQFVSETYELGWDMTLKSHNIGLNLYYQKMRDLIYLILEDAPLYITDYPYSLFSTNIQGFLTDGLSGHTGIEARWDLRQANGWRFGLNQSVYDSRRGYLNNSLQPGRYDGGFATHFSISKEIITERKGKNRIWNFSLRGLLNGGLWEVAIDEAASENLESTFYLYPGIYDQHLPMYKRVDVGISRTIAFAKVRWRYSLDIQNVFGLNNTAYHYYDPYLKEVVAQEQLGFIPVFSVQASW
jgi:hypothetical protein